PPAPPRRWPSRLRGWLRRAAIAACFVLASSPWPRIEVPLALIAAGGLLHLLSKGYLVRRSRVTREGPYRWVRHPFYLANVLLESGLLLLAGSWQAVAVYLLVAHFAYGAAMEEEESDLAAVHGEEWTSYAARTPRLLPWRLPGPRGGGPGFSIRNLIYEREIPRLMRLLSLPLGLLWWQAFLAQGGPPGDRPLLPPPSDRSAMLLVGFLGVQAASWFTALLLRAPRLDGSARFETRDGGD
ncbi:MAG: isoprenylcysteine carboxylmethyltransferase family protein, partial [Planctomycetaceae bacterium]|nr:isoprenylcysteine carboxylmethyltransferase family protein [Planctomycetaceae bacterium]